MWCHEHLMRGKKHVVWVLAATIVGAVTVAYGETRVVPLIAVGERYDSNVFLFDTTGQDVQPEDYVTSAVPQVVVIHRGTLVNGSFYIGATGEHYVRNSDLDYVGFNAGTTLDLTQVVNRISPRLTLRVSDNFLYTPLPPSFLAGGDPSQVSNPLIRGIQAFRVNTTSNFGSATGSYLLSPTSSFLASYSHALVRFGGIPGEGIGQSAQSLVFDSTNQTVVAGPSWSVSRSDIIRLNYQYQFTQLAGFDDIITHSGTVSWARTFTPSLSSTASVGATALLDPFVDLPTRQTIVEAGSIYPNGGLSVTWRSMSTGLQTGGGSGGDSSTLGSVGINLPALPGVQTLGTGFPGGLGIPGGTTLLLNYSAGVYPMYFLAAGPAFSQVIGLSASHSLTDRLTVIGGANYASNVATSTSSSPQGDFSFKSYATNLALNYLITPTVRASVIHSYGNYDGRVSGVNFVFDRQTVMFAISMTLDRSIFSPSALGTGQVPEASGSDRKQ